MNNLAKSDIFSASLLYIIKVIVISLILFNFNTVFAEETSVDAEPFEIWGESTNQFIPQLENSDLEESPNSNTKPPKFNFRRSRKSRSIFLNGKGKRRKR